MIVEERSAPALCNSYTNKNNTIHQIMNLFLIKTSLRTCLRLSCTATSEQQRLSLMKNLSLRGPSCQAVWAELMILTAATTFIVTLVLHFMLT